jgi:uncharacterized FlaG/YvyC family protein
VVEVRDPDSGDIIRQIPPEELVKFRQHAKEFLGRLIDCLL